ncbi:MAG TPA: hypothetical protein VII30_08185 [Gemmatimonadaceae bacterium]
MRRSSRSPPHRPQSRLRAALRGGDLALPRYKHMSAVLAPRPSILAICLQGRYRQVFSVSPSLKPYPDKYS